MSPEQLTTTLRRNGLLVNTRVESVHARPMTTTGLASTFSHLSLRYSDSHHKLPTAMVVKYSTLSDRGAGEAAVYEQILGYDHQLPITTCYGIIDDGPERGLGLLFEDLSQTHHQTAWPVIPSLSDCRQAIDVLAQVHAHWWGKTDTLPDIEPPIARHLETAHLRTHKTDFFNYVGESLAATDRQLIERVLNDLESLQAGRFGSHNTTLLHSDPHFWNFLYANTRSHRPSVIFDWPLWRTGYAASDLAYMIALHLYPEHRRRFEPILLQQYIDSLSVAGVDYPLAELMTDYRYGILNGLLMPVMAYTWQVPPHDWLPKLEKALAACRDHDCAALLG